MNFTTLLTAYIQGLNEAPWYILNGLRYCTPTKTLIIFFTVFMSDGNNMKNNSAIYRSARQICMKWQPIDSVYTGWPWSPLIYFEWIEILYLNQNYYNIFMVFMSDENNVKNDSAIYRSDVYVRSVWNGSLLELDNW